MKSRKTIERELKTLARSLREREGRVIGYSDRTLERLPLLDQLDFLNQFVRDANAYAKRSGKVRFNYARDIAVFTTLPEIRKKLLEVGYTVMRGKDDAFTAIEDICCGRSRHFGTTYTNLKLSGAVTDLGLTNAKLGRAGGFSTTYISNLWHCSISPIGKDLEWTDRTRRICAYLGYSPEELFPTALWAPFKKDALQYHRFRLGLNNAIYGNTVAHIAHSELRALINAALNRLKPYQRTILCYHFGLNGYPQLDPVEIAKIYGVNSYRIKHVIWMSISRIHCSYRLNKPLIDTRFGEDPLLDKACDPFRPTGHADNWGELSDLLAIAPSERDALPLKISMPYQHIDEAILPKE